MADMTLLRILAAATLALSSPAWCCCNVLGAGCASEAEVTSPGGDHCGPADASHCHSRAGQAKDQHDESPDDEKPDDDKTSSCGCESQWRQTDRNAQVAILSPAEASSHEFDTQALLPDFLLPDSVIRSQTRQRTTIPIGGMVCAESLYARCCQLCV